MKKIISVALALALVLSLGVSAFAEIKVDGSEQNTPFETPGDAQWVSVDYHKDDLTVTGDVTGKSSKDSVNAQGGKITINGSVTESDSKSAIYAKYDTSFVTVGNDVTESGDGNAIYALDGATVIVYGNVNEEGKGGAINTGTDGGVTVKVGGNVTETFGDGDSIAVLVNSLNEEKPTTVIIEGTVTVASNVGAMNYGELYLGELNGKIITGLENNVHYLIGFTDNELLKYIGYEDLSSILEYKEEGIEGAKKDYYFVTKTADAEKLKGKSVTLKPNDSNKILTVSGHEKADVTYTANADGTVTFLIGEKFLGGLQNLVLVLKDKTSPSSEPVYYIIPAGSVTTASVKLPEGVAEGLIKALDSADHAGITVDSSLVGDGSVKVLNGGKELSAKDFSTYTHADGSIDVIMSNTYLFALGSGSYDFTVQVGGTEIEFTVLVAEA